MDLKRVRTFVTVAELGSVSQAALRLHITQPALSRQIHDFQQELGLKLFDRVGRRLVLTSEGEQMLAHCRTLLTCTGSLGERAQALRSGDTGVLKIAASPVQIEAISTILHGYARRYPQVEVRLIEAVGPDILAMLERGDVHLGILMQAAGTDDRPFGRIAVPPIELVAAFHRSFELKADKTVELRELAAFPLLLLDTGFVVRKTFDALCRLAKLGPKILIESRAPSNLLALAEAQLGVAIISSVVMTHRYDLRVARVTHDRKLVREARSIVWDNRRALPRYAQDFAEVLAAHMGEHGDTVGAAAVRSHASSPASTASWPTRSG
jgi:DNA-binding transcriptional LysR family regulator